MKNYLKLNNKNLDQIVKQNKLQKGFSFPNYNRHNLKSSIVHIGIGNFHRSHQSYYSHLLLKDYNQNNWGITGIEMQNENLIKKLKEQDNLYSLIMREEDNYKIEIIGSIIKSIYLYNNYLNYKKSIDILSSNSTKIISMTVTEKGYHQDLNTGLNDYNHPDIIQDLKGTEIPKTLVGLLYMALNDRYLLNKNGLTILCCDNLTENGNFLRSLLFDYINIKNPSLLNWVENKVSFPNSMVDRITPISNQSNNNFLLENFDYIDEVPIMSENFCQWIIEDNFFGDRPKWENVGVEFVQDVIPFELTKLRILNGAHFALCHLAALKDFEEVDKAMQKKFIIDYLKGYMNDVAQSLPESSMNLEDYKNKIISRFQNSAVKDKINRILMDSSKKALQIFPSLIKEIFAINGSYNFLAGIFATYIFCSIGKSETGRIIDIIDPKSEELKKIANVCIREENSKNFINILLGKEIAENERFLQKVDEHLKRIKKRKDVEIATLELIQNN